MKHVTHWINGAPYQATAPSEVPSSAPDRISAALGSLRDRAADLIDPERSGPIYDPAVGEVSGTVDFASVRIVDEAVAAAKAAFAEWGRTSITRRTQVLFAFRELLNQHKDELAALITAEHGKVFSDAVGEVTRGLEVVEFACGMPHLLKGGYSSSVSTGVDVYSIRQPLGVVGIISPFNFPAMVPMWFFPIAIAAGNTVVVKPSEKDPSPSNLVAELWKEAGLPDGVFNVVHGDKVAVDALLTHPDVKSISFVGSTPIAKYVYETGTAQGKRVQALGGRRTTWWSCRTPTWSSQRTPRSTPDSAARGSGAWRSRSSSRSATRRTRSSSGSRSGCTRCVPGTACVAATWGRW